MVDTVDLQARLLGLVDSFLQSFAGLALETLPFLLFGTILSACLRTFVAEAAIRRLFPRSHLLSIVVALFAGAFIPICECAAVPLARRMRQTGLPLSTVVAFLLAAPIVNPLTIVSTYLAFEGTVYSRLVFLRTVTGLLAAGGIALMIEILTSRGAMADSPESLLPDLILSSSLPLASPTGGKGRSPLPARFMDMLDQTAVDFLDMARYLVAGIAVAALARALFPGGFQVPSASRNSIAVCYGAGSAYVLSLCSAADAFVARSMLANAPYAAILAFLVMGPMLSLKNTILLIRCAKPKRIIALVSAVFVLIGLIIGALVRSGLLR